MGMPAVSPFRLQAVGDISFEGPLAEEPSFECFEGIADILSRADVVVGNLECALTKAPTGGAPGKCKLHGDIGWARMLKRAGMDVLSLANNHLMDYGKEGLLSTIEALRNAGLRHVGAGANRHEACAPLLLEVAGRRVAFLARSAVVVSSPSYAGENVPGVASLEPDDTVAAIRASRSQADIVVVLIHWGIEEYSYPSPTQRELARRLVDAGADVILGHHPHVLQGIEHCGSGVVAYSLGNFLFNEFDWIHMRPDGTVTRQELRLTPGNVKGVVAAFDLTEAERPVVTETFTRIEPHGRVRVDEDPARKAEARVLSAGISRRWYRLWWHWYAIRREWSLRLQGEMSFGKLIANLHRLRLRHVINLFSSIRRSARMVSEKSTNPYE
jgi:poly-gamma-glutamate capsule biosynthesis protein CapA/YwtB (metallophosphatase superfamily)